MNNNFDMPAGRHLDRSELDGWAARHHLAAPAVRDLLVLSGVQPSAFRIRQFIVRMIRMAGLLSLAAGVVFFVAANWQAFDVSGRFALIQLVILAAAAVACWKPPPQILGRSASLLAFIAAGALLALFGQTYQTGADIYELFLTWALLTVPLVVAAQWSVAWGAWLVVLNLALWLYAGLRPDSGWLWVLFAGWSLSTATLLLVPTLVNLALWFVGERVTAPSVQRVSPRWLRRVALAFAFSSLTWAALLTIVGPLREASTVTMVVTLAVLIGVTLYALRQREDVFPLALVAGSSIVLSTALVARLGEFEDVGMFFVLALWLILSSTFSGRVLMRFVRTWRDGADQ